MNINTFLKSTFSAENIKISERISVAEISFNSSEHTFPEYDAIMDFYTSFPRRDKVSIRITDPDDNEIQIHSKLSKKEYEHYIDNLESKDSLKVHIYIDKTVQNNLFSVYFYDSFIDDLCNNSVYDLMFSLNKLINKHNYIIFVVFDKSDFFWRTETLIFCSPENKIEPTVIKREDYVNMRIENTSSNAFEEFKLLPNDFNIHINYDNNPFTNAFNKIKTIISLIYLSNISELSETGFQCRINGYKNILFSVDTENINENHTLFELYKWIYSIGNIVDKLLITRNVFSLYCLNNDADSVEEALFSSVKTNYQLYLKTNVDQYLEAKNSVADFVVNTVNSINDNISSILSGFKNNAIALLGFLATVFLVNIVSEQPLDNIFTSDIVRIFEIVIIGSFVYMGICISESKRKYNSLINSYTSLKNNYLDVFSKTEILQIFNGDSDYNSAIISYNKGFKQWITIWVLFLVVVFIIVEACAGNSSCFNVITRSFTH